MNNCAKKIECDRKLEVREIGGKPRTSLFKLKEVMRDLHRFFQRHDDLRFNEMTSRVEYRDKKSRGSFAPVGVREENGFTLEALDENVECYDRDVKRYINSVRVESFHPVKDYFARLPKWDGKDRVTELARRITDNREWVEAFHCWMLGMVSQWLGRVTEYGNCLMPVLVSGKQGQHKSTFCRKLLPPALRRFYTDGFDLDAANSAEMKMSKYLLINIDEMNRLGERKMERLKNLLQMPEVSVKRSHKAEFEPKQRLASFIGTSNYKELLSDPSGARRYIVTELKGFITRMSVCYSQLYAQLKTEVENGRRVFLTKREEQRNTERNVAFTRRPIEETLFNACFELPNKDGEKNAATKELTLHQIYERLKAVSKDTMHGIKMGAFGQHLAMIGVEKIRKSIGCYYRVKEKTIPI